MWVVANGNTASPPPSPIKTAFVNLMTFPGSRLRSSVGEKFAATVLLENPVGENFLTYEELVQEVSGMVPEAQELARELILPPSLLAVQATTLMKVYIRHKIHFYVRRNSSESGATLVPVEANLMEYTGQTLFMSEEVSTEQCHYQNTGSGSGEIKSAQDNGL